MRNSKSDIESFIHTYENSKVYQELSWDEILCSDEEKLDDFVSSFDIDMLN